MLTLILVTLLLGQTALSAAENNPRESSVSLDTLATPVICAPPPVGDWVVAADCLMVGDQVAPGAVLVVGDSTLELAASASLDIDFLTQRLEIDATSRVLIGPGARIF